MDADGNELYDDNGELLTVEGTAVKGCYNYTDTNRVGEAVQYIADLLTSLGYSVTVVAKRNWSVGDEFEPSEQTDYLADIAALQAIVPVLPTCPADMDNFTWAEANAIEQILLDIYNIAKVYRNDVFVCGEAICGGY
jgi:hypothetical protein